MSRRHLICVRHIEASHGSSMIAPHPTRLADDLAEIARGRGVEPKTVTMTSVATASLLLGAMDHYRPILRRHARNVDLAGKMRSVWAAWIDHHSYLGGAIRPVTGWLEDPPAGWTAVMADQLAHLAEIDLLQVAERSDVAGDHLGQMLSTLEAPGDRSARGAFYTPAALAQLTAQMSGVSRARPGQVVADHCVGGGAMAIAAVRAMRQVGGAPELIRWELVDIDPFAVAVAGVAMSIHGIPHVVLRCGDALTMAS